MKKAASTMVVITLNCLLFVMTSIISYFLCFYVLDYFFIPDYIMDFGRIAFRLLVSYVLFISVRRIFNKKMTDISKWILAILYLLFIAGLSLSREPFLSETDHVNLKIGYVEDISKLVFAANIIMYIPSGIFIRVLFKKRPHRYIFMMILYILCMEALQALLMVGYFDVSGIILNVLGVLLGLAVYGVIKHLENYFRGRKRNAGHLSYRGR